MQPRQPRRRSLRFQLDTLVVLRSIRRGYESFRAEHYTNICQKRNNICQKRNKFLNICEFAVESGTQVNQLSIAGQGDWFRFWTQTLGCPSLLD